MSGQQHPRHHGTPSNDDAPRTRSALPEALQHLIMHESPAPPEDPLQVLQTSSTRSLTSLPPLSTMRLPRYPHPQPLPSGSDSSVPAIERGPSNRPHPTAYHFEDVNERELSRLPQRESIEHTSTSQMWSAYGRDETIRPSASRSQTHPQMPSEFASSSTRSVRQPPSHLHHLLTSQVPARSHSTDYYTDSSNASAASSGGRPPQSTASSGSSHRSVRAEEWARARRPDSVGLDSNSRIGDQSHASSSRTLLSYHYGSPRRPEQTEIVEQRLVRPRISATRGTFRESPGQERRESNVGHRSRQHSTSSASTSARDRSSSPAGFRTPSAGRPYHPISDQRSERPRPRHSPIENLDEPQYRSLASRRSSWLVEDAREIQARSGDSALYYRASEDVSPLERDTAQSISTARRRGEYEASGSGSSRYEPTQIQSESTTSLLWYPEPPDGPPFQSAPRYPTSALARGSTPARSVSSNYLSQYETRQARQTVHRSFTTPLRGSQLRGPGQPGQEEHLLHPLSLSALTSRTETQNRAARAPSHLSQLSLSAPTPGYASNPAETLEERFVQDSPEVSPATHSPSRTTYDRVQDNISEDPTTYSLSAHVRSQERTVDAPPATYSPSRAERDGRQEHTSTARTPTSPEERRPLLQPETSTALSRPVYPFPPEAPSRLTVSTPYPVPGRPSPVDHQSPSSAKRAKTNSSPASSFDLHDYVNLSSSPAETASGAGTSVRSTGLSARPQRTSTPLAPPEAVGATGKRKKSPNSKSETGRSRAKGKKADRTSDVVPSTSTSNVSHRPTEAELAHIAAFSGDFLPDRQFSDSVPTYPSEAQSFQQEQSIHPQLLHVPTPQRSSTLEVPRQHDPPPPSREAGSSRVSRRDVKGKGKESTNEKSPSDETDSYDQISETELLDSKGKRKKTGAKGKRGEEREGSGPAEKPLFALGSTPTADETRRGRVKIPVACEFCRKRKMRCDGHRPSCDNCIKKASEPCSYVDVVRRRGPGKKTKGASAREKVSNKRTRETEKEQKKKEAEEAKRLEELRKQEKETRDAEIERGLVNLRDTLTRMLSPEQDTRSGQSQLVLPRSLLASPSNAPETTGDRLNLFSALSPLSPSLPLPSAPGDLSSLRMPEPMTLGLPDELQTSMPSPFAPELMDVRMASPPAMSPTFLSHSPPHFPSEMLFTQTSLSRREPQSYHSRETRQNPGNSTAQQARQGQLGDLHPASLSSASRSSTHRSREVLTPHSSVTSTSVRVDSASGHTSRTIPTPAQLLSATSSSLSTTAPVATVPSQARATEPLASSLPMLTSEQVEAIARQALGARGQRDAAGESSAGVRTDTSSRGGRSGIPASRPGQSQTQSVAGLSSSAPVASAQRPSVSGQASGSGSESALASASSRIRELGSVSEFRTPVGTASASTLTTSETVRQSSEDDTNKGKKKHTRTKRRREGGDPSPSSDSIPNVPIPASEASMSQSAPIAPTIGSVSEAHPVGVSTRQLENMRREEGHGPQAGIPHLPRLGDDSRGGDNYGSSRPSSSRPTIGQRRGRDDSFGVHYGGYEAHEGDPVSGERPSKRAKEDTEDEHTRSEHPSSSFAPYRIQRAGQRGEGEDTELEDGEIRETATDPSTGKRGKP